MAEIEENVNNQFSDPLKKTTQLWGGLRVEVKQRLTYRMYKSDFVDGLNGVTVAVAFYIYMSSLSAVITIGDMLSEKTNNSISIQQALLAAFIVGTLFYLFCAQPLVIIGTTTTCLIFDETLFSFCNDYGISFHTVRAYTGLWLALIALVFSAYELSRYVRLLTRFTQEIFSALVTVMYIWETVDKLIVLYKKHPLSAECKQSSALDFVGEYPNNGTLVEQEHAIINMPNTALFSTILTLGTFALAFAFKLFRNSKYLWSPVRHFLGNFGVTIAIVTFVVVDFLIPFVYTEKLNISDSVTRSDANGDSWLVILGASIWLQFASFLSGLILFILIFMETQISELIVAKPERGLKKSSGLHYDIVLLCFLNVICGLFGMPWQSAAALRSFAHVSALTTVPKNIEPNQSTPQIVDVKEQRISGLLISIMFGLCIYMASILKFIPTSVLYGVFLFMGINSMYGVQLFHRITLMLKQTKHFPPVPYVKHVCWLKMHSFTFIQIAAVGILWSIKISKWPSLFPIGLALLVFVRKLLQFIYTHEELMALDGGEEHQPEPPNEQMTENSTV